MKKPQFDADLWRLRIGKLSLAPGDTLVIQSHDAITEATEYRFREYFETAAPAGVQVLIVPSSIKLSIIGKP